MKTIIIIGGGLAGLVTAISLRQKSYDVLLIEKKQYPFHRVCGEYISNEVIPFLESLDIFPSCHHPVSLSKFMLTSVNGRKASLPLKPGGFGISRYCFDHFLFEKGLVAGVQFITGRSASSIAFQGDQFEVEIEGGEVKKADIVIGAYGKRTRLDKTLKRPFFDKSSPYLGVKYHIKYSLHPTETIALHNFKGGYCGISQIENGIHNLCYLSTRANVREYGNIPEMEKEILYRNPFLREIFQNAEFLFDKPMVINEISFESKSLIEDHVLMCGDAAGMITPLCGNGMAMAIHSAKLVSEQVDRYLSEKHYTRQQMEHDYTHRWKKLFASRIWAGRQIQKLFGAELISNISVNIARYAKPVAKYLIKRTHGKPF